MSGNNNLRKLSEYCDYIYLNLDSIAVRERIDDKWDSYFLKDLPTDLAIKHVIRLILRWYENADKR